MTVSEGLATMKAGRGLYLRGGSRMPTSRCDVGKVKKVLAGSDQVRVAADLGHQARVFATQG